jgi:hypothetical protein
MADLPKAVVNMMTHVVAAGIGTFHSNRQPCADQLRLMGWLTYRVRGPRLVCEPTEAGKRGLAEYLKKEKKK